MLEPEQSGSRRVLVVDDEVDVRDVIVEILQAEGLHLHQAGDGQEALKLLEEDATPPDLILLDQQMPRMSGPKLLEELAKVPRWKVIPVVMISATAGALLPGVVTLLRKPFEFDALVATVRRVLRLPPRATA